MILTFNSQKYLLDVLKSCAFADEVIIVDSGSSDNTVSIARTFKNTKIVLQEWLGFGKQKQFGVDLCTNDWVFVLDSDEIITDELKDEITALDAVHKGYFVARLNYFFGKPIKRCGLYPDRNLRFFNKKFAMFSDDAVHERVVTRESTANLKHHMLHYAYENIEEFITKQNKYSSLNHKENKTKALFNPFWTFMKIYLFKLGFLDGWRGYVIAKLYAQYTFWKYIK